MLIFFAITLYLGIIFAIMQQWVVLGVACFCVFSWRFNTGWLLIGAIMLDGYYGAFYTIPWLSTAAVVWYLVAEYIRPRFISA